MTRVRAHRALRRVVAGFAAMALGFGPICGANAEPPTSPDSTAVRPGTAVAPDTLGAPANLATPTVSILGIAPLPSPIKPRATLHLTVQIRNPTPAPISHLQLQVHRGDPISSEQGVATAIATPPATTDLDIASVAVPGAVAANGTRNVVLTLVAGFDPTKGLCLACGGTDGIDGIYPVDVSLSSATSGTELSRAHILVPAFAKAPAPVRVSWLWPLIDRPHRATSDTVFTDDELAESVAPGGRLDRALRVAELVKGHVRLTLVIDPDLIDSLTVMSQGYTVRTSTTDSAGTGGPAAAAWLKRLHAVAAYDDVSLTGYADPDVDALVRRNVEYSTALPPQVTRRLSAVLGAGLTSTVDWPPGENLTSAGLDAVVGTGASAVLLADSALPGALNDAVTPDALSPLPAATGTADALVLSSALQPTVLAATGPAATVVDSQRLVAELAARAVANPLAAHYAVLAPTRYVDPQPAQAAAAMLAVADAPWAEDVSVRAALTSVAPVDRGALQPAGAAQEVSGTQIASTTNARSRVAAFRDCLTNKTAPTLLGGFADGLARASSASWRLHPAAGRAFAAALVTQIAGLEAQVSIEAPPGAHYTLTSSDAPLYITVQNKLTVPVRIRVRVTALDGEQGFRTDTVPLQTIEAGARQEVKVRAHVERSGKFRIRAELFTPHGLRLQRSRSITVNSTALGSVALWITGIAFGVLILALVVRAVRRLTGHGKPGPRRSRGPAPDRPDSGGPGSARPDSDAPGADAPESGLSDAGLSDTGLSDAGHPGYGQAVPQPTSAPGLRP